MFELDIKSVRVALVKSVRVIVAVRQMMRPLGLEFVEVQDLEREFRQQAGEVQKAEKMMVDGLPVVLVKDWAGRQELSSEESRGKKEPD